VATSEMAVPVGAQSRAASRGGTSLAAWLGIGFPVLLVAAWFLDNTPDGDASNAKWLRWYADGGHRTDMIVSAFLFVVAGLCLLAFLNLVWSRAGEGDRLPLGAATFGAAAIGIGGVCNAVVPGAMAFGNAPEPSPDVLRFADNVGYPITTVAGMIAVAFAVALISLQARRSGLFGQRLTVFSIVMAVITLASFLWFPQAALLIWCIVVGIVLALGGGAAPA